MEDMSGAALGSTMLVVMGIWSVVAIAFYVWYLWALSKLFPRIGLPSSHGWIPVWNQWQLIGRGGLPGWIVLLGFVPGLSIVVLVVSIIAIHRLNSEYGKGVGFTVLGAFLPPLWAMMLAGHIDQTGYGATRIGSASQGAPSYVPPSYAPPGYAAPAPQQTAPGYGHELPPVPQAPGYPAPQAQAAAPQPQSQFSAPQPPAPQRVTPVPPAPGAAAAHGSLPQGATAQAGHQGAVIPGFAEVQQPARSQQGQPAWGFSNTTEDAFERLAAQGAGPRADSPLGATEPQRPFSWPLPEETVAQVAPAPPAPAAPAAAASASPVRPAAPAAQQAGPTAETSAIPAAPAATAPEPARPVAARPAPEPVAPRPADPSPAEEAHNTETMSAPQRPARTAAAAPVAPAPAAADDEDEDDRTIVVPRRKRWGIELPGGQVEELVGDDVVIGRRPEGPEGVSTLKIADPTRTLSKSHVRMRRLGDEWTIEDLQSTNGVSITDGSGEMRIIEPGRETPASRNMTIGTLEVVLREIK